MKKRSIFALVAIAMLCATPAFAAGKSGQPASLKDNVSDVMSSAREVRDFITGQDGGGKVNATVNTINNSKISATQNSKVEIGNITNPGGTVNANVNTIGDSTLSASNSSNVRVGNLTGTKGIINASVNTIGGGSEVSASDTSDVNIGNINGN